MKDVAYLLHGHADAHLDTYFRYLRAALHGHDADAIEQEWRAVSDRPARLRRFLAGWRG